MFVINKEKCSQCGECQDICPCGAIEQQPDDSFKIDAYVRLRLSKRQTQKNNSSS